MIAVQYYSVGNKWTTDEESVINGGIVVESNRSFGCRFVISFRPDNNNIPYGLLFNVLNSTVDTKIAKQPLLQHIPNPTHSYTSA